MKFKLSHYLNIILIVIISLILSACNSCNKSNESKSNSAADVIKIHRYEKALFIINPDSLKQKLPALQKQYKFFINGDVKDEYNIKQLHDYLADPFVKELYEECLKKYPDLNDIERQLSDAFANYKKLFPSIKLPKVYTYISGISNNTSVSYLDSVLVIPLDMYLGKDFPVYTKIGIPQFVQMRFSKNYIIVDCMKRFAESNLPVVENRTLLDIMIEKGKILYFSQAVSNDISDETNIAYTKDQLEWNKSNEANLWSFMIANKLLFVTDNNTINKFTGDSPFTSVISQQAPGRIGEWLGWQIVKSYMENNKNVSLPMLMKNINSQQILNNSGYKPKK